MKVSFVHAHSTRYACVYLDGKRIMLGRWPELEPMPSAVRRKLAQIENVSVRGHRCQVLVWLLLKIIEKRQKPCCISGCFSI